FTLLRGGLFTPNYRRCRERRIESGAGISVMKAIACCGRLILSATQAARRPDTCVAILLSPCSLSMDQVDQVTDSFHAQNLAQSKFGSKGHFHLVDQLDMAQ